MTHLACPAEETCRTPGWELHPLRLELKGGGAAYAVTRAETAVLGALMRAPGRTLPRAALLAQVRDGGEAVASSRALDAHVWRLRRRIPQLPVGSVHGIGYVWREGIA